MDAKLLIRARCSYEEKTDLLKTVALMTAISVKCNRDGIQSIGETLDDSEIPFLKIAVKLIIKGYDTRVILAVLENIIHAENIEGKNTLEKILIFEAIRMILSEGKTGNGVKATLLCILGERFLCDYLNSETLNKEIAKRVYEMVYKLNTHNLYPEAISEKVLEWMEGCSTYAALYYAMNDLLNSPDFLTPFALVYLLNEKKEVFNESIAGSAEKILMCVDKRLTSKIIEKTKKVEFIEIRTDIRGKLLGLISEGYLDFEKNAELALNRVLSSPAIPAEFKTDNAIHDKSGDFARRISEFMKIFISSIDEGSVHFDFQACKEALIKIEEMGREEGRHDY